LHLLQRIKVLLLDIVIIAMALVAISLLNIQQQGAKSTASSLTAPMDAATSIVFHI
jgi:hypothetical protein